ncbi:MAG: DUF1854 domain-containing protein [Clostridia bacterium]|nr:DUF1854 domain-containing protein [Clostridia bacterium]
MAENKKVSAENAEEEIDIFYKRPSVTLTAENARFYRSGGGLISMELKGEGGESEVFERVVAIRSFPITDPDAFISIREPDSSDHEKGAEIGIIPDLNTFDAESVALLREELARRYFTPKILKIFSMKEKLGHYYWDVSTDAGKFSFVLRNAGSNIRTLEDGRVLIFDIDGNCFEIPDPDKLDKASYKKIEVYL